MDVNEIMTALDAPVETYQRDAVQAAMDQPEEVVPLLLERLKQVLADPEKHTGPNTSDSFLPNYAVTLLGYHRVHEAHSLLVELMSLPGELPFDLFGDGVHNVCITSLWKTSGGDPADIIRLFENPDANEYCRSSAIKALTHGLADGTLPRQQVVKALHGLFDKDEPALEGDFVRGSAASQLSRIWPGDSMEVLKKAFDDRLIDTGYIGLESIEAALQQGQEARFAAFERRASSELAETPHQELQHWACFQPDRGNSPGLGMAPGPSPAEQKKRSAATRKRKRKQAKAARKKGRSKKKKKR